MTLPRSNLTDAEWQTVLEVLLARAPGKRGRGRHRRVNRHFVNGILWQRRSGAQWRDVPREYGKWSSIYRCFQRWDASDTWEKVEAALAEAARQPGGCSGTRAASVPAHMDP